MGPGRTTVNSPQCQEGVTELSQSSVCVECVRVRSAHHCRRATSSNARNDPLPSVPWPEKKLPVKPSAAVVLVIANRVSSCSHRAVDNMLDRIR